MDSLYASLAEDLGVPISALPAPPANTPTPRPLLTPAISQPSPLRRLSLPPQTIHANVYDISATPPSTPSLRSRPPSLSSGQLLLITPPPSPTVSVASSRSSLSLASSTGPTHVLRRISSPREKSLRELRVKESEACLQRVYEHQTLTFLEGPLFRPMIPPKSKLRRPWPPRPRPL